MIRRWKRISDAAHCGPKAAGANLPAKREVLMRALLSAIIVAGLSAPAAAQSMAPATVKMIASSAEIEQLIAKAKADRKGEAPITVEPILSLAPYRANLEYRPIAGPAALHDTDNELMVVIQGSGTITLGGQMVNPTRPNPANETAAAISGGTDTMIAKGDMVMVPHGTPHQISAVTDGPLVLMTLHLPK
jgi:mannose-6-phosphate isomerase-like protein (cupin superfamily)